MGRIQYIAWLGGQAFSALLYYWPVTIVLVAGAVITLALKLPLLRSQFCSRHLLIFSPLAVTLLILLWGALMEHPSCSQRLASSWPSYVVLALLIVQLVISIWVVWFMKGYRWFSAFTVALEQWFAVACSFVAAMSVTGDWL
ncbi:MAG: hypothetical protein NTW91_08225 [Verrucomicrobia bacterium]|nr:hypothetical protein [Verrucomicrobiota bacterium]